MFAKLLLIVITMVLVAMTLLVNRQERLNTAHEMKVLHENLTDHQQTLWKLQTEIAERIRPADLRAAVEAQLRMSSTVEESGDASSNAWAPLPSQSAARQITLSAESGSAP